LSPNVAAISRLFKNPDPHEETALNPMVKHAENKKPVVADDKLKQLTERQLADISKKIRKKNRKLLASRFLKKL